MGSVAERSRRRLVVDVVDGVEVSRIFEDVNIEERQDSEADEGAGVASVAY